MPMQTYYSIYNDIPATFYPHRVVFGSIPWMGKHFSHEYRFAQQKLNIKMLIL